MQAGEEIAALLEVVQTLLGENGCPWDREQTHATLTRYLLEEAYEVIDAIETGEPKALQEELGDVLFQVVFHAALAEKAGWFNFADVVNTVKTKMVSRHPHVFGEMSLTTSDDVMNHWENFKKQEGKKALLDGIPPMLPALLRAYKLQEKAARVGFDWPTSAGAWDKLQEELQEYQAATLTEDRLEEMGDMIFALVNCARLEGIEAEAALQKANQKFIRRFAYIEQKVLASAKPWESYSLAELDQWWDEAKK